jgi:hypothetical protein
MIVQWSSISKYHSSVICQKINSIKNWEFKCESIFALIVNFILDSDLI